MSTATPQTPAAIVRPEDREIKIVSHSNLFYWWPVWAVALVLAALTRLEGHNIAVVPSGTDVLVNASGKGQPLDASKPQEEFTGRDVLIAPKSKNADAHVIREVPHVYVSTNKGYGVFFVVILLVVVVITNVPMRGLWSVVVLITIVLMSIIFQLAGWWEHILDAVFRLHVYINAAGYFMTGIGLLGIWLVTFVFFDPQIYMVFTPKQLRVQEQIGGGETTYDTTGMRVEKPRNDLFRHWILGLGSGDLRITTSGAAATHLDFPNVLFVGYKLRQINDMLREVQVTQ
jgi:hypothetical protein